MRPFLFVLAAAALAACATPAPTPAPTPASGTAPDRPAQAQGEGPQTISFSAYPCFGFCPDFTVTVAADGGVTYLGRRFTRLRGAHDLPDNPALFQALTQIVASPRLPWPRGDVTPDKGSCPSMATDMPSYELRVAGSEGVREFTFYAGCGGPEADRARALTDAVMQALTQNGVPTEGVPDRGAEP